MSLFFVTFYNTIYPNVFFDVRNYFYEVILRMDVQDFFIIEIEISLKGFSNNS